MTGKEGLFELPVSTVKGTIWQKLDEPDVHSQVAGITFAAGSRRRRA